MDKVLARQLKDLLSGDLVCIEWCDASLGKSRQSGSAIDVPVRSWGIFVGLLGERNKHIVLAQNCFRYASGLFDIDYTAIPLTWTEKVSAVAKAYLDQQMSRQLLNSFLVGGGRPFGGGKIHQQRLRGHG